jgi:hypothetical protein
MDKEELYSSIKKEAEAKNKTVGEVLIRRMEKAETESEKYLLLILAYREVYEELEKAKKNIDQL